MIVSLMQEDIGHLVHVLELPIREVLQYMQRMPEVEQYGACVCQAIANMTGVRVKSGDVEYDADQTSGPVIYQMLQMYGVSQKVLASARATLRRYGYEFVDDVCHATETSNGATISWMMRHSSTAGSQWWEHQINNMQADPKVYPRPIVLDSDDEYRFRLHMLQKIVENNPDAAFKNIRFNIW
jgi:hypothetical protein